LRTANPLPLTKPSPPRISISRTPARRPASRRTFWIDRAWLREDGRRSRFRS